MAKLSCQSEVGERSTARAVVGVAGLSADKVEFYKPAKTEITYSRDGDQWTINVGIVGIPNGSRVFKFSLGQPYDSVNIDGTPLKVRSLWSPGESKVSLVTPLKVQGVSSFSEKVRSVSMY